MKHFLIFLFLIFISLICSAQNTDTVSHVIKKNKVYTGCSVVLKGNKLKPVGEGLSEANLNGSSTFNFSAYGSIFYTVNSRLTLQTGFGFHTNRLRYLDNRITFGCDFDINGRPVVVENSYVNYITDQVYLGLPLSAKVVLLDLKSQLYASFGFEYLFNLNRKDKVTFHECGADNPANLVETEMPRKKNNLVVNTGIGLETTLGQHRVFFEPTIAYGLVPTELKYARDFMNLNDAFASRFFQVGVLLGMYF